jgi:hypothetical protein
MDLIGLGRCGSSVSSCVLYTWPVGVWCSHGPPTQD